MNLNPAAWLAQRLPTPAQDAATLAAAPVRYRLNWGRFTTLLLPPALRRPRLRAWLQALAWPLRLRYDNILDWMVLMRREASYNGQTIVLERALNDQFSAVARTIRVVNNTDVLLPNVLFFTSEGPATSAGGATPTPYYIDYQVNTYLAPPRENGDLFTLGFASEFGRLGFTVYAAGKRDKEKELRVRIDQLKMATTQYSFKFD